MSIGPLAIQSPLTFLLALAAGAVAIALIWRRRAALPQSTTLLLIVANMAMVLAAGDMHLPLPRTGEIVLMVDCSPSTRSAAYRDRKTLDARIAQLLGSKSFRVAAFGETTETLPAGNPLADLPAGRTVFSPPGDASAVVLFSDGQFDIPTSAPPTFPVIDGGLLDARDAAITDATLRDGQADVTVTNRDPGRTLSLDGGSPKTLPTQGEVVQRLAIVNNSAGTHRAVLSPGDAWPENDVVSFAPTEPRQQPRWWIGGNAPAGWLAIAPSALPTEPAEFLAPSVIALSNVSADELSPTAIDRLQQYTRDLGGSLLILGGDHAFSLGGYGGTALDELSPLASDPPTPARQWLLLTDASGSMAGGNRWASATAAITSAVRELPPADSVSVGSFSGDLTWWITGLTAREARKIPLPPGNIAPSGPTNLQLALSKLVAQIDGNRPTALLILTDGEASLEQSETLAKSMQGKQIRLHVLAIGSGAALPALKQIASITGGQYATALDATRWLEGVRSLVRGAPGDRLIQSPLRIEFDLGTGQVPPVHLVTTMNRTWAKSGARVIAQTFSTPAETSLPAAATHRVGNGSVTAMAFMPNEAELAAVNRLMAEQPTDPRYAVDWSLSRRGRVRIDAKDGDKFLNGQSFELDLSSVRGETARVTFTQIAPGRYEADVPASADPRLAIVSLDRHEIARAPLSGRYAKEFDAIELNERALQTLADRTGGRVIGPDQKTPIEFPRRWEMASLTPYAAILAAVLTALGLIQWKRFGR